MKIPHQYPKRSGIESVLDTVFWCFLVGGGLFALGAFLDSGQTSISLSTFIKIIIPAFALYFLGTIIDRMKTKRDLAYYAHLDDFEVDVLVRAMNSIEMKRRSKKAIRVYLDERRPGWSIQ